MPKPRSLTSSGVIAFIVAWVATGMKHGVRMEPCGVVSTPARAPVASSEAVISNEKLSVSGVSLMPEA